MLMGSASPGNLKNFKEPKWFWPASQTNLLNRPWVRWPDVLHMQVVLQPLLHGTLLLPAVDASTAAVGR